uniref:Uncharacterized protein n=1 Tax=Daphnia galeata TaxID=27404 RepID=A0A8J2WGG7_9CRUS|nr:unnamed protein product [Daphnia galeata]
MGNRNRRLPNIEETITKTYGPVLLVSISRAESVLHFSGPIPRSIRKLYFVRANFPVPVFLLRLFPGLRSYFGVHTEPLQKCIKVNNQLIASVQDLITGGSETTANSIDQNENHIPFGIDKRIMCMGEPWTRNSCFFFTSALVKTFHFSANIPGQPLPTLEPVVGFTSAYDHDGFKAVTKPRSGIPFF